MVKKLMPVMAVPDMAGGMSSLIWGYINIPLERQIPNAKKSRMRAIGPPVMGRKIKEIKIINKKH